MNCVFRSLPLVASLLLIFAFGRPCFASIDVSSEQNLIDVNNNKTHENTSEEVESSEVEYEVDYKNRIIASTFIISVIFSLATIAVYSCLPELLNLLGKCLLCYLTSLTVTFAFSACLHMNIGPPQGPMCIFTAHLIFFMAHSSFIWTNVLSFDLWSSFRATMKSREISDRMRFYLYVIYVYGWASLMTIIAYILDSSKNVPDDFKPSLGTEVCYLNGDETIYETVYFRFLYLPVCVIFLINSILFTLSTMKILQVQRELKRSYSKEEGFHRQNSSIDKKNSYMLFLRLMIVFGLTWFFEGISFVAPEHEAFLIFDILNGLQGLIIFLLFVMKARVRKLIMKKWSGTIQDITSSVMFTSDSSPSTSNTNYRLTYITRQSSIPQSK